MSKRVLASVALALLHPAAHAEGPTPEQIEQGRYLAAAGNCVSCHTSAEGEPFAGGVAFETPFGKMYSTNITPDEETGIGGWTEAQFAAALREGVRPNGDHLYPAFPYTAFTLLSDAEVSALFAYFKTVAPVSAPAPENELSFPFNQRWLLGAWKSLYFEPGRYAQNKSQSAEWNRGAYLVKGPGHCGACHTPRNWLGAEDVERALAGNTYKDGIGGRLLDWSATNLTSSPNGLAKWSADDLSQYLKHGYSEKASVFGPMNDVIVNSMRHLTEQDTRAIAVYLKSLPASAPESTAKPDEELMVAGGLQYDIHCGTCHLPTGAGSDDTGPPLLGSPIVLASDPASLVNITLHGPQLPHPSPSQLWQERKWQPMGAYTDKLSDEDAAALLTFVRNSWGNQAAEVTAEQVGKQR
jgi:mono/diheme cytochrome c family protein